MPASEWPASLPGVRRDEPLSRHSQYGIGGPADWFIQVADADEVAPLRARSAAEGVAVTVIGAGSNTLIRDGGVRGLVVEIVDKSVRVDGTEVIAAAGVMMPRLALDLAREGIAGLEFGIGVPGTCGASVRGNAGAFGTEVKDVLVSCTVATPTGEVEEMSADACAFTYRHSVFKAERSADIVLTARFRGRRDDPAAVRARTDDIQARRKASQPYGIRSLGSVFTNPQGDHAGRLIEAAGLKGERRGGAQISEKHANFIVNVDAATAADVLALVALAHDRVLERFGVDLVREIVVMGEDLSVHSGGER